MATLCAAVKHQQGRVRFNQQSHAAHERGIGTSKFEGLNIPWKDMAQLSNTPALAIA